MDLNKKTQTEQLMISTMDMLADPEKNKGDIAVFLKSAIDSSETLKDIMGEISDDVVTEIIRNDEKMDIEDSSDSNTVGMTDVGGGLYKVLDVPKMTKQLKESFVQQPSREEARYLMDLYYQYQAKRIVLENQLRALNQGKDLDQPEIDTEAKVKRSSKSKTQNRSFLEYHCVVMRMFEDYIKQGLEMFSDSAYLGKWAKANKGIGPVIATCLLANLELRDNATGDDTDMHPSSWWDYCGLNNNRRPWIGRAHATEIVNDLIEENNGIIDDALVKKLCAKTQWKYSHYEAKAKAENGAWKKDKLIAASCIIPYNKNMKLVMYKIGHSFLMCKNKPDSLYGRLLKDRLDYETKKNEAGDYADQAANALATKNYGKDTVAYKYYSQGKLPPAHISQRCQRYVTKLFISHLFEAAYYNKYGKQAPAPYALLFCGHTDYIPPEVPYDSIPRDEEYVKLHPTQPLKKIITPIHFVNIEDKE